MKESGNRKINIDVCATWNHPLNRKTDLLNPDKDSQGALSVSESSVEFPFRCSVVLLSRPDALPRYKM